MPLVLLLLLIVFMLVGDPGCGGVAAADNALCVPLRDSTGEGAPDDDEFPAGAAVMGTAAMSETPPAPPMLVSFFPSSRSCTSIECISAAALSMCARTSSRNSSTSDLEAKSSSEDLSAFPTRSSSTAFSTSKAFALPSMARTVESTRFDRLLIVLVWSSTSPLRDVKTAISTLFASAPRTPITSPLSPDISLAVSSNMSLMFFERCAKAGRECRYCTGVCVREPRRPPAPPVAVPAVAACDTRYRSRELISQTCSSRSSVDPVSFPASSTDFSCREMNLFSVPRAVTALSMRFSSFACPSTRFSKPEMSGMILASCTFIRRSSSSHDDISVATFSSAESARTQRASSRAICCGIAHASSCRFVLSRSFESATVFELAKATSLARALVTSATLLSVWAKTVRTASRRCASKCTLTSGVEVRSSWSAATLLFDDILIFIVLFFSFNKVQKL
eukprot:PhM_4_TR2850/c1_g1_i1/m.92889